MVKLSGKKQTNLHGQVGSLSIILHLINFTFKQQLREQPLPGKGWMHNLQQLHRQVHQPVQARVQVRLPVPAPAQARVQVQLQVQPRPVRVRLLAQAQARPVLLAQAQAPALRQQHKYDNSYRRC